MAPKAHVRRFKDLKMRYDLDFPGRSTIIRQRVYKTPDGSIHTPITPLALAMDVESDCPAPRSQEFQPRHLLACFENPDNQEGVSNLKTIIPYRPTDPRHLAHAREISAFAGVDAVRYFGETHERTIAPYLTDPPLPP